ncbi:EamA family transporter [Microbacterium sp. RU33B]|uniref:EamA family transporter n=1 Tax=Microbacterium sp. RU33B TaxID=1907390 RepID=UPI00095CD758|nr:EamA family transporter [Microbacterium sp. RU33B]SIT69701.1 EamA-like transporter family protein [Microbacterium sp. RU33B]
MLSAALALVGALVYGSADFLGGLAARRLRPLAVTAIAALTGLVVLLLALPFFGNAWLPADVAWGALSGVTGAIAIVLLYACLAIGPMSILSPLTAVVSAVAPMLWGLLVKGETLAPWGYAGLALALVAVVLVGLIPGQRAVRPSARGLAMAVGAGLAIGAFLIIIDQTSDESGLVPLLLNRGVNTLITGGAVAVLAVLAVRAGRSASSALDAGGRVTLARRRALWLAIGCGVLDAAANLLLLIALRSGDLSIVSALTALYPGGTILLAAVVLRERIAAVQWFGLALALTAGGMLALA